MIQEQQLILIICFVAIAFVLVVTIVALYFYDIGRKEQIKRYHDNVAGTILIETSDPDGPYLFLDLDMPLDVLGNRKTVVCKVDTNGVTSRE